MLAKNTTNITLIIPIHRILRTYIFQLTLLMRILTVLQIRLAQRQVVDHRLLIRIYRYAAVQTIHCGLILPFRFATRSKVPPDRVIAYWHSLNYTEQFCICENFGFRSEKREIDFAYYATHVICC